MTKTFLLLVLLFSFQVEANPVSRRLWRVLPENSSLTVRGIASQARFEESVKVLVWNIKKTEEKGWQQEFERYSNDRDLVLLQEVYETPLFLDTIALFDAIRWDMGQSFEVVRKGRGTGVMIGAKVDPLSSDVEHSPDLEPFTNTPKASLFNVYPLQDQQLLVITVHGINFTTNAAFRRQMMEIEKRIALHDGPVLWAGDFNTHTDGRMSFLNQLTKRLQFTPVEFKNGNRRMRFKLTGNYFDHAFVRGLKVKNAEVIVDSRGSDHKPLLLDISL